MPLSKEPEKVLRNSGIERIEQPTPQAAAIFKRFDRSAQKHGRSMPSDLLMTLAGQFDD